MVDKILTVIMLEENSTDPEWFTPYMKYLSMKKEILGIFSDKESWGEFGTERRIIALTSLLDYFRKTKLLADQFPHILNDVVLDNKNLVIQRVLHLPDKLYEQLLLAVIESAEQEYQSYWDQPSSVTLEKIEKYLMKRKTGCLSAFGSKLWSEVHSSDNSKACENISNEPSEKSFSEHRADLRKLLNKIYSRLYYRQNVQEIIREYENLTEDFISKYPSKLSVDEADTYRKKVEIAENAAKAAYSKASFRTLPRRRTRRQKVRSKVKYFEPNMREMTGRTESIVESVDVSREDLESDLDEDLRASSCESETDDKVNSQNMTDHVDLVLPEVPQDLNIDTADLADIPTGDIDDQLLKRLSKLQFFSKVWDQKSEKSDTLLPPKDLSESCENNDMLIADLAVPVESTEHDRQEFNDWYYARIGCTQLCQSSTPVPVSSPSSDFRISIPNEAISNTVPISELNSNDMVNTSQQELLEIITNLCFMQTQVVAMVIIATTLLDKLDRIFKCTSASLSAEDADPVPAKGALPTQPARDYSPDSAHSTIHQAVSGLHDEQKVLDVFAISSRQESIDMVSTSQTSDPVLNTIASNLVNILLDKLNLSIKFGSAPIPCSVVTDDPPYLPTITLVKDNLVTWPSGVAGPLPQQAEEVPAHDSDQKVKVSSMNFASDWNVTPWKRRGIIFTKLY